MYSIGICITTDNPGIRTAVINLLPAVDNPKVNTYDYRYEANGFSLDGTKQITCEIRFNVKEDRDQCMDNLKGLTGVITACDTPSYIRPHVCGGNASPCVVEEGGVYKL
jgi:hypothetical protein